MQLLAELGRNHGNHEIQAHFQKIWEKHEVVAKLEEVFKLELTTTVLKRVEPLITDAEENFDTACCKSMLHISDLYFHI